MFRFKTPWDDWARAHRRPLIVVRVLLAAWILFVVVALCALGYWWGLVFLPFLPLDLWLLWRLLQDGDVSPGAVTNRARGVKDR